MGNGAIFSAAIDLEVNLYQYGPCIAEDKSELFRRVSEAAPEMSSPQTVAMENKSSSLSDVFSFMTQASEYLRMPGFARNGDYRVADSHSTLVAEYAKLKISSAPRLTTVTWFKDREDGRPATAGLPDGGYILGLDFQWDYPFGTFQDEGCHVTTSAQLYFNPQGDYIITNGSEQYEELKKGACPDVPISCSVDPIAFVYQQSHGLGSK